MGIFPRIALCLFVHASDTFPGLWDQFLYSLDVLRASLQYLCILYSCMDALERSKMIPLQILSLFVRVRTYSLGFHYKRSLFLRSVLPSSSFINILTKLSLYKHYKPFSVFVLKRTTRIKASFTLF